MEEEGPKLPERRSSRETKKPEALEAGAGGGLKPVAGKAKGKRAALAAGLENGQTQSSKRPRGRPPKGPPIDAAVAAELGGGAAADKALTAKQAMLRGRAR